MKFREKVSNIWGYHIARFILLVTACIATYIHATDWTIFVYMAADNGLHSSAIADIVEMQKGLNTSGSKPKIIAYIDHIQTYKGGVVEYLQITPSNSSEVSSRILRTYPDENSGSGETLTKFLKWAARHSSEKNMLILWSHSNGWQRNTISDDEIAPPSRWICNDWTAEDMIGVSTGELQDAIAKSNTVYDIIMLDACHAGSIEFVSELNGFADYIIATPDYVPVEGSAWTQILEHWEDSDDATQIAQNIMTHTMNAYDLGGVYNVYGTQPRPVAMSVYDMKHYDAVFHAVKDFADNFANPEYADFFTNIKDSTPTYTDVHFEIDLMSFAQTTLDRQADTQYLVSALEDFIIYTRALNSAHEKTISIWFPDLFERFIVIYRRYYHNLQFEKTGWGRFLNYVWGEDTLPPNPVEQVEYVINLDTIYINWKKPIDPCPIEYTVTFYDSNRNVIKQIDTGENTDAQYKIPHEIYETEQTFYFSICAIDEAGNISIPYENQFTKPLIENDKFYVAPNPVRGNETKIHYFITRPKNVVFSIYDVTGQMVYQKNEDIQAGEGVFYIQNLQSGVYYAIMLAENTALREKFAVIR